MFTSMHSTYTVHCVWNLWCVQRCPHDITAVCMQLHIWVYDWTMHIGDEFPQTQWDLAWSIPSIKLCFTNLWMLTFLTVSEFSSHWKERVWKDVFVMKTTRLTTENSGRWLKEILSWDKWAGWPKMVMALCTGRLCTTVVEYYTENWMMTNVILPEWRSIKINMSVPVQIIQHSNLVASNSSLTPWIQG